MGRKYFFVICFESRDKGGRGFYYNFIIFESRVFDNYGFVIFFGGTGIYVRRFMLAEDGRGGSRFRSSIFLEFLISCSLNYYFEGIELKVIFLVEKLSFDGVRELGE